MSRRGRQIYDKQGNNHFITTSVVGFLKIFSLTNDYYNLLINTLKFLLNRDSAKLIAYVLMPNHVHLIVHMPVSKSISDFMRDFKKYTSKTMKEELKKRGFNKTIIKLIEKGEIGKFKLWKDRFDDVIIYSEKVMETKINYIHYNPVRANLVKEITDWKYSSARNYYLGDDSIIEVYKV